MRQTCKTSFSASFDLRPESCESGSQRKWAAVPSQLRLDSRIELGKRSGRPLSSKWFYLNHCLMPKVLECDSKGKIRCLRHQKILSGTRQGDSSHLWVVVVALPRIGYGIQDWLSARRYLQRLLETCKRQSEQPRSRSRRIIQIHPSLPSQAAAAKQIPSRLSASEYPRT